MDISSPIPIPNSPLTPVFGDNVQDLLSTGALNVNPTGIIVVNSIADTVNDYNSGVTTLRDAINQANADTGEDLIVFERSLFSTAQTITLSLGELDLTHNLDIIAPRDTLTGGDLVTVSGNNASRVFGIESGATVNLDGLIVADGSVTGDDGGGIKNSGTLTLDSSIVSNNSASGYGNSFNSPGVYGGGIYNSGTFKVNNSNIIGNSTDDIGGGIYNDGISTINNSTISDNSTAYFGGGIANYGTSTVNNSTISGNLAKENGGGIANYGTSTINNSTISDNSAAYGCGIYNYATGNGTGICTVNNSTISGNSTYIINGRGDGLYGDGGGIYNDGTITINNSTINSNSTKLNGGGIYNYFGGIVRLVFSTVTQNIAANGGGMYIARYYDGNSSASASVRNTIIASNLAVNNVPLGLTGINPDVSGTFNSNGYNLIGDNTGSTGFDEALGDIVGTSDNPIDPRLAPLDNNGGPTQTIALLPDSPAIDAADPTLLDTDPTTDQRGLPRVSNGRADIGAFEVQV